MSVKRLVLHVGGTKCASSTIQSYLSKVKNSDFCYASIKRSGEVISGERLFQQAAVSPHSYVSSARFFNFIQLSDEKVKNIFKSLNELFSSYDTVILSNEEWYADLELFLKLNFFKNLNCKKDVVLYVRPQVEWMNSAWWQWGAWTRPNLSVDEYILNSKNLANWFQYAQQWKSLEGSSLERVHVRPITQDTLKDFCSILNFPYENIPILNKSLGSTALKLLLSYREEFRPGPHGSHIDFIIEKHINIPNDSSPWVLDRNQIKGLLKVFEDENKKLVELLDSDTVESFLTNSKWFDHDSYNSKNYIQAGNIEWKLESLVEYAYQATRGLKNLSDENASLKLKNASLSNENMVLKKHQRSVYRFLVYKFLLLVKRFRS